MAIVAAGCLPVVVVPPAPPVSCPNMPADNYWHADVTGLPRHARSAGYITTIGSTGRLKADFGSGLWAGGPIGIPYVKIPPTQPFVPITFDYDDESDPGPYPIPADAPIEGGPASTGDRHILVIDQQHCRLYETWSTYPNGDGSWRAGSGAVFELRSNAMRPAGWTSADAAGLPVYPGLVRYDEVAAGVVDHAIRITVPRTQRSYVWPARHQAGATTDLNTPPMGTWLRLKPTVDPDAFGPQVRPIIVALQTHGAIVADNGSAWYLSGAPDERWDNDALRTLNQIRGSDFEVVDASTLIVHPDSGQVAAR